MIRLSVWFESLKWRISNGRRHTLNWWYLVLAGVLIVWLGVAEAVALPAYGGYAHEVFSNLLAGVPSTPPAAVQVTVFQWSCSAVWLVLAYRQWARRQFKWMIVLMVCSLLYMPFVVYLMHEVVDQCRGVVRLEEKPPEPSIVADDEMIGDELGQIDSSIAASVNAGDPVSHRGKTRHGRHC